MNRILQEIAAASVGAVTTDEAETIEGRYLFTPDFSGFGGHFPDHPILPAIVEVLIAVSLVGRHEGSRQRLVAIDDAKFLTPVLPEQVIVARCRPKTVKGKLLWDAQLSVEGTTTATMLVELEPAEERQ